MDNSFPATNGITSLTVTLAVGNQPLSDMDAGATGAGGHGENGDAYDNLALDFGFYRLSVGNLVFSDANKDGLFNIGDAGLNGVTVELYQAGNRVAVTTTTGGGAYLFAGETDGSGVLTGNPLTPGTNTYTIQLPASQLAISGLYSTKDTVGPPQPERRRGQRRQRHRHQRHHRVAEHAGLHAGGGRRRSLGHHRHRHQRSHLPAHD